MSELKINCLNCEIMSVKLERAQVDSLAPHMSCQASIELPCALAGLPKSSGTQLLKNFKVIHLEEQILVFWRDNYYVNVTMASLPIYFSSFFVVQWVWQR